MRGPNPFEEKPPEVEVTAPPVEVPAPVPELIDGRWLPGTWREFKKLMCVECKWDTLGGIDAARQHSAQCSRCAPPTLPGTSSGLVLVADAHGNEIQGVG